MNYSGIMHEEKILINRYLENSLTGIELKEFLDKLENDVKFRNEVSFQNLLVEGIQLAEDKRQIDSIEKFISYKKPVIPTALKLIFTFFIVTIGGIVLWNYIDPDSAGKKHNYFSLDYFRKNKTDTIDINTKGNLPSLNKKPLTKSFSSNAEGLSPKKIIPVSNSSLTDLSDSTEIVVKKDQLLISIKLLAEDLSDGKTEAEKNESSIAKSTVEKLNPSGGLPEIEERSTIEYMVEFWVSPVNYKGYKLIGNKLILFGIEEPDAVHLFSKNEKLWMKYGQDYFSLMQTENFESLIKSSEIPSAQK